MKRLLMLVPLTLLAVATAAEAQSQAGGLPDVSAEVKALQTQVQTQQTEVKALQGQVQTQQTEVKALQGQVQTQQTEVKALQGQVQTQQTEVKALQGQVNTLESTNASLQQELIKEIEARTAADLKAQQDIAKAKQEAQQELAQEIQARVNGDVQTQQALATEAEVRLNADTNLGAKLDVFGGADIFSAQFEIVGAGSAVTHEFVHILSEFVGPGSWVAIAAISNLGGDTLNSAGAEGPALRACELRNVAGGFIGGMTTSDHDADTVAIVVTGGINVAPSAFGEISLWCRATHSDFGVSWDGAQMVTLKVTAFRED